VQIIISRTDNIGDVVLSLPVATFLKKKFPQAKIHFIGRIYTQPLIENCSAVDVFINKDDLETYPKTYFSVNDVIIFLFPDKTVAKWAKDRKIGQRIGTSHRWWHWVYLNKLINFSRRKSDLHEAQLNFKLVAPLGISQIPTLKELQNAYSLQTEGISLPDWLPKTERNKKRIILHPKSKGSAREWRLEKYKQLIDQHDPEKYDIFITGSADEGIKMKAENKAIFEHKQVTDLTGKLTLLELVGFIGTADALVACSTGPLHIAAALGKTAIGLYPNLQPMHPARWKPIGNYAHTLTFDKPHCTDCKTQPTDCVCIQKIEVAEVLRILHNI
jgi:heptosyltransferase III